MIPFITEDFSQMNMRVLVLAVLVLSMAAFAQTLPTTPAASADSFTGAFQVRYLGNLNIGDSYVNIVNNGALNGAQPDGNLCANVYVYDPNEEPVSCCACPVTPNGLVSLSARNDLISNPVTPGVPTAAVVKIVFTANPTAAKCDAGAAKAANLSRGGIAWATTLHANTSTSPATYGLTETAFDKSELSASEFTKIVGLCGIIEANFSGYGICKSCRAGALGASTSN